MQLFILMRRKQPNLAHSSNNYNKNKYRPSLQERPQYKPMAKATLVRRAKNLLDSTGAAPACSKHFLLLLLLCAELVAVLVIRAVVVLTLMLL